jgi:uncharacterized membrane protein YebE (DUF533 family)
MKGNEITILLLAGCGILAYLVYDRFNKVQAAINAKN